MSFIDELDAIDQAPSASRGFAAELDAIDKSGVRDGWEPRPAFGRATDAASAGAEIRNQLDWMNRLKSMSARGEALNGRFAWDNPELSPDERQEVYAVRDTNLPIFGRGGRIDRSLANAVGAIGTSVDSFFRNTFPDAFAEAATDRAVNIEKDLGRSLNERERRMVLRNPERAIVTVQDGKPVLGMRVPEPIDAPEGLIEQVADIASAGAPAMAAAIFVPEATVPKVGKWLIEGLVAGSVFGAQSAGAARQESEAAGETEEMQDARASIAGATGFLAGALPPGIRVNANPLTAKVMSASIGAWQNIALGRLEDYMQGRETDPEVEQFRAGLGGLFGGAFGGSSRPMTVAMRNEIIARARKRLLPSQPAAEGSFNYGTADSNPPPAAPPSIEEPGIARPPEAEVQAARAEQRVAEDRAAVAATETYITDQVARLSELTGQPHAEIAAGRAGKSEAAWVSELNERVRQAELVKPNAEAAAAGDEAARARRAEELADITLPGESADVEVASAIRRAEEGRFNQRRLGIVRNMREAGVPINEATMRESAALARITDNAEFSRQWSEMVNFYKPQRQPKPGKRVMKSLAELEQIQPKMPGAQADLPLDFGKAGEPVATPITPPEVAIKYADILDQHTPIDGDLPIEIMHADGSKEVGMFHGWLSPRHPALRRIEPDASGRPGWFSVELKPGDRINTPLPTMKEWEAYARQIEGSLPNVADHIAADLGQSELRFDGPPEPFPRGIDGKPLPPVAKRKISDIAGMSEVRLLASLGGGAAGSTYGFLTGDTPEDRIERALLFGAMGAAAPLTGAAALRFYQRNKVKLHEAAEDSYYRLRKMTEQAGITLDDSNNITQRLRLLPGIVTAKLRTGRVFAESLMGKMHTLAKQVGEPADKIRNTVNAYLYARHAVERNAHLGAGAAGITDAQANQILQSIADLPYRQQVQDMADAVQQFHDATLGIMRNGDLIDAETEAVLRQRYPHHVPLNRILDNVPDHHVMRVLGGRSIDVRSSGLFRAGESALPVNDIVGNVLANFDQAIIRSERNKSALMAEKFVADNPHLQAALPYKPAVEGTRFDGSPIFEDITDPAVLGYMRDGKRQFLKWDDPNIAVAMRGMNMAQHNSLTRVIGAVSRWFAAISTRFNPEFAPTNKVRDLQEATVYMLAQKEMGGGGIPKFATAEQAKAFKAVADGLMGRSTPGARLYQQMVEDGATTGGFNLASREKVAEDMEAIWKRLDSTPRQAVHRLLGLVDGWNTLVEDSTRFAIYKHAIDNGASRSRAAFLAREGTVDFNRMGTMGPLLNAAYAFSNASIQGSAKMLRAMANNPRVATKVVGIVGLAVVATRLFNDSVDPDWKKKVSKWDQVNGLPIMLPWHASWQSGEEANVLVLPVSWGLKPIKAVFDGIYDMADGEKDVTEAAANLLASTMNTYNPVGGTTVAQALTPTALDLIVDLYANRQWSGQTIKPDRDPNAPEFTRFKDSLRRDWGGRLIIAGAEKMWGASRGAIDISPADIDYALRSIFGGAGNFVRRTAGMAAIPFTGEMPQMQEMPVLGRFLRESDPGANRFNRPDELQRALELQSADRHRQRQAALAFLDRMKTLPASERAAAIAQLDDSSVEVLLREVVRPSGESAGISQLGIRSGARAQYLYQRLAAMPPAERAGFIESLDETVVSDEVADQLADLIEASPLPTGAEETGSAKARKMIKEGASEMVGGSR